ncbi:energy transducer TonB [Hymenobacter sp. H14-R3]|uniref:energy transducer TonB n=1 Tax=Hymenobacter sp. H14-R3 TaxID=3046308 RepID=UPI0024BA5013|nr:energy transducer TonB [Hymenobacter sp. H14-R3]MDJ0366812.1 energy transducer TonB [Hymenobacter sp. H14-R3]
MPHSTTRTWPGWQRPALALLMLGGASAARAQVAPPPNMALMGPDPTATAYQGPRYPGGPDSLHAAVRRYLRAASPTLTGELFLRLELENTGRSRQAYFLPPPPGSPAIALYISPEAQNLAQQLVQRLLPWQLPNRQPGQVYGAQGPGVTIVLNFGPEPSPAVRAYADENPTFSVVPLPVFARSKGTVPRNLAEFFNRQIRYPYEDLRRRRGGTVFAYFEVSEQGTVEQRRIVGTVSPTLDAEVLRVLQRLPSALTPPRYQGRPTRVSYVLPMSFSP